ncbi:MAG: URC4/urg3 family protein [Cyanobacteria bacterium]|nr:URC4/urg3 family protein [Cyanobacteriota bacterium]
MQYLLSTQGIRDRCHYLFELARANQLAHFRCELSQLETVADYVIQTMQQTYPTGNIPIHSRWRHFEAGGINRIATLNERLAMMDPVEAARSHIDLVVTSVLLDAGAGANWYYHEAETGQVFQRSEGLAVASFHLFLQGGFSSCADRPWQADAIGLQQFTTDRLQQSFQVTDTNPLVGVAGRVALMQRLGAALYQSPELFGVNLPRPGNLVDYLLRNAVSSTQAGTIAMVPASQLLAAILRGFGSIWAGRLTLAGVNLGDVWPHSALPDRGLGAQLVPFHKLSQWLTYSLVEPLQLAGITVTDLEYLTGLPEYRNGGLFVDLGVLRPKYPEVTGQPHTPGSEPIVEWRALTVALLDRLADLVRCRLGLTAAKFPLAKLLEGGTWAAGRRIARELRPGGVPPIQIVSDGTVF